MNVKASEQSTYPLDYHFRGKRAAMRPLFDELVTKLTKEIHFEYKIGKAYVGLLHTLVFAALRIHTEKIIVEFVNRKQVKSPRITKVIQASKQRWAYFVNINKSQDIDKELINWIVESYE